jgi:DNA replication protein DnaC
MIPKLYEFASLSDFDSNLIAPVLDWIEHRYMLLFIYGNSGVGKSHLMVAIVNHLCSIEHGCAAYVLAPEISIQLRNSFEDEFCDNSEYQIIKRYRKNIIGAFDDIGANKVTDYVAESWYAIINYRYQECIPSIYSSNLSLDQISALMGDRIASRLASGTVFELKGDDRRLGKEIKKGELQTVANETTGECFPF